MLFLTKENRPPVPIQAMGQEDLQLRQVCTFLDLLMIQGAVSIVVLLKNIIGNKRNIILIIRLKVEIGLLSKKRI